MTKLVFQIIAGVASFWLADKYIPGVEIAGGLKYLFIAGGILGLINYFVKPLLRIITFPLRIITLGLFSWIINMAIIWVVDIILLKELEINGLIPLFWTTLIAFVISFFLGLYKPKKALEEEL